MKIDGTNRGSGLGDHGIHLESIHLRKRDLSGEHRPRSTARGGDRVRRVFSENDLRENRPLQYHSHVVGAAGSSYRHRETTLVLASERPSNPERFSAVRGSCLGFDRSCLSGTCLPGSTFLFWEEELVGLDAEREGLATINDPRVSVYHDEHHSVGNPYSPDRMRRRRGPGRPEGCPRTDARG
jgi:hypothetical protein